MSLAIEDFMQRVGHGAWSLSNFLPINMLTSHGLNVDDDLGDV